MSSSNKGPDGLCIDCGCVHDYWHAENPDEWSYKEGCWCYLCQEYEAQQTMAATGLTPGVPGASAPSDEPPAPAPGQPGQALPQGGKPL